MAFSTGNVYPLTTPAIGGSVESDELAPVGEYAMSALGREALVGTLQSLMVDTDGHSTIELRLRSALRRVG